MSEDFVSFDLAKKLKEKGYTLDTAHHYDDNGGIVVSLVEFDERCVYPCPEIHQVLKWLRDEKNIDIEIRAEVGMLGDKVYVPFISTYTEFTLETSPDVIRYRQKKFNPASPLPHEIIPALTYFKEWEEAALAGIDYVIDNLI